jgi:hypothetical protein
MCLSAAFQLLCGFGLFLTLLLLQEGSALYRVFRQIGLPLCAPCCLRCRRFCRVVRICAAMSASVCVPQHASCGSFWCVAQLGYSRWVVGLIADGFRGMRRGGVGGGCGVMLIGASSTDAAAVRSVHVAAECACGCCPFTSSGSACVCAATASLRVRLGRYVHYVAVCLLDGFAWSLFVQVCSDRGSSVAVQDTQTVRVGTVGYQSPCCKCCVHSVLA